MLDWFWLWLHIRGNRLTRKIEFEREIDVYSDDMEDWWDHFKWILYVLIIYSLYHNNFISSFSGLKFVLEYESVSEFTQLPSIFHIATQMIMTVFSGTYKNYHFFNFASLKMYLTAVIFFSKYHFVLHQQMGHKSCKMMPY